MTLEYFVLFLVFCGVQTRNFEGRGLTHTDGTLIQGYNGSPKSHTSFVLGITCIRDKEAVCPERGGIPCVRGTNLLGIPFKPKNDAAHKSAHPLYLG